MTDEELSRLFDDGKEPGALRTIGEVASALGVRQHVLRYWEDQFPALRPVKRSGGRRYYRSDDVRLIMAIDRLVHREGYTLRGARQALAKQRSGADDQPAVAPAMAAPALAPTAPAELSQQLRALRDGLLPEKAADCLPELRAIRDSLAQALELA